LAAVNPDLQERFRATSFKKGLPHDMKRVFPESSLSALKIVPVFPDKSRGLAVKKTRTIQIIGSRIGDALGPTFGLKR
jgi:hypothetical protein